MRATTIGAVSLAALASFIIVSCGNRTLVGRTVRASVAQSEMVGKSRDEILACMGAPSSRTQGDEIELWQYAGAGERNVSGTGVGAGGSVGGVGVGGGGFSTNERVRSCVVNVAFRDGLVEQVSYLGRTGGVISQGEQCSFLVSNCVN